MVVDYPRARCLLQFWRGNMELSFVAGKWQVGAYVAGFAPLIR